MKIYFYSTSVCCKHFSVFHSLGLRICIRPNELHSVQICMPFTKVSCSLIETPFHPDPSGCRTWQSWQMCSLEGLPCAMLAWEYSSKQSHGSWSESLLPNKRSLEGVKTDGADKTFREKSGGFPHQFLCCSQLSDSSDFPPSVDEQLIV